MQIVQGQDDQLDAARIGEALETSPVGQACFRCQYDLRGIDDEQPCPECGLLARRSRRADDELHNSRPGWLRRLSWGVWLVLLALFSPLLAWILASLVEPFLYRSVRFAGPNPPWYDWVMWAPFAVLLGGALLLAMGGVLLAGREGYPPADLADRWRRGWLRLFALAPLFAGFIGVVAIYALMYQLRTWVFSAGGGSKWDLLLQAAYFAIGALLVAAGLALPPLLFFQLRNLAKRARSAHLAEHCAIVGIGASLSAAVASCAALVGSQPHLFGLDDSELNRSQAFLFLLLAMGVSTLLFAMWAVYLLVRFAVSFGRASRELRRRWRADDHSSPVRRDQPRELVSG